MHVVFEEAGKLVWGRVLSEAEASAQIELDSGKRTKAKLAQVLIRAGANPPSDFMGQALAQAQEVDLSLAWEAAPDEQFGFEHLASEYFGPKPSALQQTAMLLALHEAPHYFRRAGKGNYKKADAQTLALALAAIEKRRLQQELMDAWTADLVAGVCPAPVREQLYKILFKPDKNAPEYKAVAQAARQAQLGALPLLQRAGAIDSAYAFHWQRFLFEHFPKGTAFPGLAAPQFDASALPLCDAQAFSIDDSQTTEIDDAMSVQGLGTGTVILGIHIAAPSLGIQPGDAVDAVARTRLSTVYMPGHKITMLPDNLVQQFTLQQGQACAAVSLWVEVDEQSCEVKTTRSALNRVHISHNLRHDQLGETVTPAWLEGDGDPAAVHGLRPELAWLHRFAQTCKAAREQVRGKPESFNRPDYNFKLLNTVGDEPLGNETVHISTRARGEPLDLIVAECMIVANHHWGKLLADRGIPGIYRSQHSLAPGIKVRMGTKALPHAGIGVACYAWSTSPLRRYTDLVNQWQIAAAIEHGATAALSAPFKPKDAALMGVVGAFDAAYTSYNQFQNGMERYWVLQHLQQTGAATLDATVIKDAPDVLLRALDLPLVFGLPTHAGLARGQTVRVAVRGVDLVALELHVQFVERLDADVQAEADEADDDDDDDMSVATGLQVKLDDAPAEQAPN
jgi:exoribonuclease II